MGKKHLKRKSYSLNCLAAPPLLFTLNTYIRWLSIVLLMILIIVLIIFLIRRKIKKEKIINNRFKLCVSGIISIILYHICTIYLIPSDHSYNFYPLELLVLLIVLLLNLFVAFKCRIIKKQGTITLTIILTILLIFTCIISVIKIPEGYNLMKIDTQNTNYFKAILRGLPIPSSIEKQDFIDSTGIYYYVPIDTNDLLDFYKANIPTPEWELLLKEGPDYNCQLYYQKINENAWIEIDFAGTPQDNNPLMQGREYPFTYLIVRLYRSNPLTLSEDGNWYYIPPVVMSDMMGGCGDFTLY